MIKKHLSYVFIVLIFIVFVSGCSSNYAIEKAGRENQATVLFKLDVINTPKNKVKITGHMFLYLQNSSGRTSSYFFPFSPFRYADGDRFVNLTLEDAYAGSSIYFLTPIKPGKYKMLGVKGSLKWSSFYVPVLLDFEVKAGEIIYIGNIVGTVRKQRMDDQTVVDSFFMRNSSFEVVIKDDYEYDMQIYRAKYPKLENYEIKKAILPAWTKPLAKDVPRYFRNKGYVEPEGVTPMKQEAN
ncbi:hypothetical protein MNBD_DELTA01-567 [hydrothermal vent metagenome]|uniref:Lipoprotein n=1 Tax=hydrothermal vent metagenome TaxID=652676 RepID=A0A3B0QY05_9ZZZZ